MSVALFTGLVITCPILHSTYCWVLMLESRGYTVDHPRVDDKIPIVLEKIKISAATSDILVFIIAPVTFRSMHIVGHR
jgi:hypothetical protein